MEVHSHRQGPILSIEVTRECPLGCPGCYAYGDMHLGGFVNLRNMSDYRGDDLVNGIVRLTRIHRPLHVSLVGGEPLVRHRELSRVLPILGKIKVHTMVVTSAVIPIPREWMSIPRVRVTVSVDGLPELPRKGAFYIELRMPKPTVMGIPCIRYETLTAMNARTRPSAGKVLRFIA